MQNDLGRSNWTRVFGVDSQPYAVAIKYWCPREGWGYASDGSNERMVYCLRDGTWSNQFNIETCQSESVVRLGVQISPELPCKTDPPAILPGEGAERNYGVEVTTYR